MDTTKIPVYLEVGKKRVFACAVDWPGWCRSGGDEERALAELKEYGSRYAVVAREAGVEFGAERLGGFDILERLKGSATTDFGAPGSIAAGDYGLVPADEAERTRSLVAACWTVFDGVAGRAPASLTKGPRGGGRDRDKIVDHVLAAEMAYARKIGVRQPQPGAGNAEAIAAFHAAILGALGSRQEQAVTGDRSWPVRYAARRIAWHVLDHAWEMEDRGS
jgi:hypothetical protein